MTPLEQPYRGRAVPPGSTRYWSWLFADPAVREPLLAAYALMAEWRVLLDPATEVSAARIKLAWWHEEISRLIAGAPLHPVTRYIAALPHATIVELGLLQETLSAVAGQLAGAPLERAVELEAHAAALYGVPLLLASRLADPQGESDVARRCTTALATGEYLSRAVSDYRRDARVGRLLFPVDELLAAQIQNDDLAASTAPPHLADYLEKMRQQAVGCFTAATRTLAADARPARRHLAVLALLGANHVRVGRHPGSADFSLADLYNAWNAARRWSSNADS